MPEELQGRILMQWFSLFSPKKARNRLMVEIFCLSANTVSFKNPRCLPLSFLVDLLSSYVITPMKVPLFNINLCESKSH